MKTPPTSIASKNLRKDFAYVTTHALSHIGGLRMIKKQRHAKSPLKVIGVIVVPIDGPSMKLRGVLL